LFMSIFFREVQCCSPEYFSFSVVLEKSLAAVAASYQNAR
jgi:hypothetical protein